MKPTREIWLLVDSQKPGGIESHILQLALGLQKHNKSVRVIFLAHYGIHPLRADLDLHKISHETLDGSIYDLYSKLKRNRPKLLHTHGYKAGIEGRLISKFLGIPVISTYHAGEKGKGKLYFYDLVDRLLGFLSNRNLAVSQDIANSLFSRSTVMNNFVDTDNLHLSKGSEIAFVGRVSPEKGPDVFLSIARRFPEITFSLYGDGPELSNLREEKLNNLILRGQKNSMATCWSNIALLVMPSRQEGLPLSAIEAMARGIPVIASDVGELGKLIEHQENGWLAPAEDVDQFSCYLNTWLTMPSYKKKILKSSARRKIENHFSACKMLPDFIKIYDAVMK